jgi:hypothetical protein
MGQETIPSENMNHEAGIKNLQATMIKRPSDSASMKKQQQYVTAEG